jgi:DHA1 family tetracycline resistance protein-like MFS transporter
MKRSPLVVIFTTVFIDLVGFGIVIPVLPFYAEGTAFNATPRTVGLLFASYSIMQLIFSPVLGGLSDKYGRRPVLLLSIIGTGIGFLMLGFAKTLFMLFAGRILDGITGGNISTAQAYIADITTEENRAKGMGLIGAAFGLGFIFGPAIGGILSRWGIHVPFIFAAVLCFANAMLLYFTLPETVTPDHPAKNSAARGRSLRNVMLSLKQPRLAFVLVIYFLFIVAFSIMTTAFSLYTMFRFGYDAQHTGISLRLRRTDRRDHSRWVDRAIGEAFRRVAVGDCRRILFRDQFICGSVCWAGCRRFSGAARWRRRLFDGQLARDSGFN